VSKVWAYIKANKLQNPKDGREILTDDKLRKVFGKDKVTMFEMNKHLALHLGSTSDARFAACLVQAVRAAAAVVLSVTLLPLPPRDRVLLGLGDVPRLVAR
jgi:hypothetical protein